jgi:hypothetical protein
MLHISRDVHNIASNSRIKFSTAALPAVAIKL